MEVEFTEDKSIQVQRWKVREGRFVQGGQHGHVLFSYVELEGGGDEGGGVKQFKSTQAGVIKTIHVKNGEKVGKGSILVTLEPCSHPTVMREMCAECGKDLRKLEEPLNPSAAVSMIHSVPDLRISMEHAQKIGKIDEERLLTQKKLVLLVDLDQTLIHTTNDNVPNNLKDVFHFQLWGHGSVWYHTRLRPRTNEFLEAIDKLYELHICTFGTRSYAHMIARLLDPSGKYFGDRILSRDECFSQNSKTANLKELFPRGDHMVCIIDDREDVWNFAPNLIHVKPYHFFRHTGDINAPPGLGKKDEDDKTGFEFGKDGKAVNVPNNSPKEEGEIGNDKPDEEEKADDNEKQTENSSESPIDVKKVMVRRVTKDLSLSDEEDSDNNGGGKSSDDANEGDKEESADETGKKKHDEKKGDQNTQDSKKEEEKPETEETKNENENDIPPVASSAENANDTSVASSAENVKDTPVAEGSGTENENGAAVAEPAEAASSAENKNNAKPEDIQQPLPLNSADPNVIEVEDPDDYLLYLEEILKSIHTAFYSLYDDMCKRKENQVPDVKNVLPYVRRKVLKSTSIVFSGVVPTEVPVPERKNTKAYSIAASLGAQTSEKIIPPNKPGASNELPTTHVVAARPGTAKVNEARRYKGIHIVTPDWLWCCSEQWRRIDEHLFPLIKKASVNRHPPGYHSSHPRRKEGDGESTGDQKNGQVQPGTRKQRTPSGRFMDTINPLLSFSMDEIESMGHEVDDIINESESSSSEDEPEPEKQTIRRGSRSREPAPEIEDPSVSELTKGSSSSSSSDSVESETERETGLKLTKKRKRKTDTETEDEPLNVKFRRGEAVPSEVENLVGTSDDDDDESNDQEEEWMARQLEMEFLGGGESSQDME